MNGLLWYVQLPIVHYKLFRQSYCVQSLGFPARLLQLHTVSERLRDKIPDIRISNNKDQLRGIEGELASQYFSVFDEMILQQKEDFYFHERNRRPPLDRVNALLSFVYTLLTSMMAASLETVGLDPCVGFLHGDRPGRYSLALDMMEELRPALADRFVLRLLIKGWWAKQIL